jgi:hypothetical protein
MTVILMTDRGRRLAGRRYCRRCDRLSGLELVTMQQLELLVAMRMRTRQERLHRLITGRASLPERWTTGRRNTQTRSSSSWLRAMAS